MIPNHSPFCFTTSIRSPRWGAVVVVLTLGLFALPARSALFSDIVSAVVDNNGTHFTLNNSPATSYTPAGDSDLLSVEFSDGKILDTSGFLSGVGIDGAQISEETGFIQRAGLADDGEILTPSTMQTGSANAASYLSHGARGLSLSTGINYVAGRDAQTAITFDASISNPSALLDGTPDFLFGDVADSHSDDLFEMLDHQGNTILSLILSKQNWSDLGSHVIDRVEENGSGDPVVVDNNTSRGIALMAFSVEESDLINDSIAFETQMASVTQFRITIPDLGDEPKTDYAFFGVNIIAMDVPTAVIPEPSMWMMLSALALAGWMGIRKGK
ncbi:hypothetical protein P3T73_00445 [Kiritimatiellota bacterium B12222]|nr:hypothetical protein P3T73_00445 [Kiritimatiellota bacterium B12222]